MKHLLALFISLCVCGVSAAQGAISYDAPDPATDALVGRCLKTEGVSILSGTDVICYNAAIFPEQFLKLNEFPPASHIIITSPGGNVATARLMSTILDRRGEPAIIAGQCMSACAMVLLPGLDSVHIHHSAHIAVHGITMMKYRTWWGWLRGDAEPTPGAALMANMGYDFGYSLHNSGRSQMKGHLKGQSVDEAYIQRISDDMFADALAYDCRVDPKNYWGMVDAEHIQKYLGERITKMEAFAQNWADPNNSIYKSITHPIGAQTYIFDNDYEDAVCD